MTFEPGLQSSFDRSDDSFWFVFDTGRLLIKKTATEFCIPRKKDFANVVPGPNRPFYFGCMDGRACFAAQVKPNGQLPDHLEWINLRTLFGTLGEELFWVAGRANQLVDWDQSHRYCGRCGGPTEDKNDERAKQCPQCGLVNYPRLSPAVITAVFKDDRILLARNKNFKGSMFSVLAGFVEPGETLEECVKREIHEEVGIVVKNVRYFGSQPWPFPNSLMIGFTAEYATGEIKVDDNEIAEAGWFSKDGLPPIPPTISISRRLIDWFIQNGAFAKYAENIPGVK